MSLRKQVLQGAAVMTLGEAVGYAASFVRNMILARVLSKADYGMAAVFGMVISLLEFTAKLSVGRILIQDREGEKAGFIATGHALQATAGAVSAVLIVCLAPWLARWFGIAEHAWALTVLGAVVLVRGLEHLDVRRFERNLRFGPSAAVEAVPQVVVTLAAWPVAAWLGDYRAVLLLLMGKATLGCLMAHLWAEQPYRWGWQAEYARRMLRFGWPLVLTGFLMFGIMQGDQFLVATYYNVTELAPYAAALSLVMAPHFLMGRVFGSVALPLMARAQDDTAAFVHRYRQVLGATSLYAACLTAGMMIAAEGLMQTVYGPKYAGAGVIMTWLAAVAGVRALRTAVAIANLAQGDSQSQLWANLFRAMSLLPAFACASMGKPLWMIAACGLIGELWATGYGAWRLRQRAGLAWGLTLRPAMAMLALSVASGWVGWKLAESGLWMVLGAGALGSLVAGALTIWLRIELRTEASAFWEACRAVGLPVALRRLASSGPSQCRATGAGASSKDPSPGAAVETTG